VGRNPGRPRGEILAVSGEFQWPPVGRFSWPPSAGANERAGFIEVPLTGAAHKAIEGKRLGPVLVLGGKKGADIADGFHRVSHGKSRRSGLDRETRFGAETRQKACDRESCTTSVPSCTLYA
jgi:hypothetical protein